MILKRTVRKAMTRLAARGKLLGQKNGPAAPVDCYFGCVNEWRYPAFLYRALCLTGVSTWEIPVEGVEFMIRHAGWKKFLADVRVVPKGVPPHARQLVLLGGTGTVPAPGELRISGDYFSDRPGSLVMPYFIHPDFWAFESEFPAFQLAHRRFRIGFAGTVNRGAYGAEFSFPILNRTEILEFLQQEFRARLQVVRTLRAYRSLATKPCAIILVAVESGGDSTAKHILQGRDYLRFLGSCAFFLAPPGAVMPFAHNLVEAMYLGAIPILNYGQYLTPALENNINCLSYTTLEELRRAVDRALAMSETEIARLRRGTLDYVKRYLSVQSFAAKLLEVLPRGAEVLANDESKSVALWKRRVSVSG